MIFITPEGEEVEVDPAEAGVARELGLKKGTTFLDSDENEIIVPEDQLENAERLGLRPVRGLDDKISAKESAARGFASSASLGFADEVTGAARALKDKFVGVESDREKSLIDLYRRERDAERLRYELASKKNPGIYGAGYTGGLFVNPGAGMAARLGKKGMDLVKFLAAQGAAAGAGGGAGLGQADLTKGEIKELGAQTAAGGALGAVGGKIVPGLEKSMVQKFLEKKTQDVVKPFVRSKLQRFDLPENVQDEIQEAALKGANNLAQKIKKLNLSKADKADLTESLSKVFPRVELGAKAGKVAGAAGGAKVGLDLMKDWGGAAKAVVGGLVGVPLLAGGAIRGSLKKGAATAPRTSAHSIAESLTAGKVKREEEPEEAEENLRAEAGKLSRASEGNTASDELTPEEIQAIQEEIARREAEEAEVD